ncbi:MAG: diguanylate cyclase [Armatimonadota bacterium]|nr:diguanylate cyclase [Armatimonadota bacterium]MDR7534324.1 diguanylate cyclase [Armatimonadota bacterium]MDR7537494.1 diguanylate cyclase [Armatimonadota bacterium]
MTRRAHAQRPGPQFEALRLKVTLRLLALGAVAIAAGGARLLVRNAGSPLHRASLAALAAGLLGCAVLGLVLRREALARLGASALVVTYLTVSFARILLLPGEPVPEEIGGAAVWLTVILTVVWLLSYPRAGVRPVLLAYLLAMAPVAVFGGLAAARGMLGAAAGRLGVLAQTAVAGLAMLVLVRSAEEVVEGYVRAWARAETMEQLASTDALTGVPNRRYLFQELAREIALAGRHARTLSVIMFDLDTPEALLARADRALYEAKAAGRNRVALAA